MFEHVDAFKNTASRRTCTAALFCCTAALLTSAVCRATRRRSPSSSALTLCRASSCAHSCRRHGRARPAHQQTGKAPRLASEKPLCQAATLQAASSCGAHNM